jgi:hypothetical protein
MNSLPNVGNLMPTKNYADIVVYLAKVYLYSLRSYSNKHLGHKREDTVYINFSSEAEERSDEAERGEAVDL